ncbi:hypothetical protein V8B97DRAFT_1861873, partial [Scleroderma yunnanense]
MNLSCVDILLFLAYKWNIIGHIHSFFCLLFSQIELIDVLDGMISNKYWIDVQLCWGDFNLYDIKQYT